MASVRRTYRLAEKMVQKLPNSMVFLEVYNNKKRISKTSFNVSANDQDLSGWFSLPEDMIYSMLIKPSWKRDCIINLVDHFSTKTLFWRSFIWLGQMKTFPKPALSPFLPNSIRPASCLRADLPRVLHRLCPLRISYRICLGLPQFTKGLRE